jgi:hypothetical protein
VQLRSVNVAACSIPAHSRSPSAAGFIEGRARTGLPAVSMGLLAVMAPGQAIAS